MKTKYIDLIEQTFDFPQEDFNLTNNQLNFHGIDLTELIATYGAPLKFTYLPKISENINRAKQWFQEAMVRHNYG
jgi:arginine decarboxylase